MKIIADNTYYKMAVEPAKNRAYLSIKGFWPKPESVPEYLKHWEFAMSLVQPDFTLLTDASQMVAHPPAVGELHLAAQQILIKAGVRKVGEVIKDVITELQLDAVAKKQQFPKKSFASWEEAESWLDLT